MSDDDLIVVCMPVADMLHPVAGAIVQHCEQCGTAVWLAPSSVRVIDRATVLATLRCVPCAVAQMRAAQARGESLECLGLLPEQLDEVKRALDR